MDYENQTGDAGEIRVGDRVELIEYGIPGTFGTVDRITPQGDLEVSFEVNAEKGFDFWPPHAVRKVTS